MNSSLHILLLAKRESIPDGFLAALRHEFPHAELIFCENTGELMALMEQSNIDLILAEPFIDDRFTWEKLDKLPYPYALIPVIGLLPSNDESLGKELRMQDFVDDYVFIDDPERLPFSASREIKRYHSLIENLEEQDQRKRLYDIAVQGAGMGLWELDMASFETYYNTIWYTMLGYDLEDVKFNKGFFDEILHPEDQPLIEEQMNMIMTGKSRGFDLTIRLRHKDGDYRWILDRATVVQYNPDGSPSILAGSHMDITERVSIENDLSLANNTLRSLIESSPVAIYQIDPEGRVIDLWNEAAERIFGFKREEVIDQPLPYINQVNREEADYLLRKVRSGEKLVQKRVVRFDANGKALTIELNTGPLFDQSGELQSILIIASDVTELARHERELEDSVKEKNILIQEIHHRVKNNLAIVAGLLELTPTPNDINPVIQSTISRIKTIGYVHELLYNTETFNEVSLKQYCDLLMGNMMDTFNNRDDLHIACDIQVDTLSINSAIPLGLMINELFINSIKYAFDDIHDPGIFVNLKKQGDDYVFSYRDNGSGLDESLMEDGQGFGFKLIRTLLKQLNAEYTMEGEHGFKLSFRFKDREKGSHGNL